MHHTIPPDTNRLSTILYRKNKYITAIVEVPAHWANQLDAFPNAIRMEYNGLVTIMMTIMIAHLIFYKQTEPLSKRIIKCRFFST